MQAVLWELSHNVLQTDLSHISGQGVVSQDPVDVYNLLEIMSALMTQDNQQGSSGGSISGQCHPHDSVPQKHAKLNASHPCVSACHPC